MKKNQFRLESALLCLPLCLSVFSVCLPVRLSAGVSSCLSFFLFLSLIFCLRSLFVYLIMPVSLSLPLCVSICLCLCLRLSVYLSVCLSVSRLSVSLSLPAPTPPPPPPPTPSPSLLFFADPFETNPPPPAYEASFGFILLHMSNIPFPAGPFSLPK